MKNTMRIAFPRAKSWQASVAVALFGFVACAAMAGCGSDGSNYDAGPDEAASDYTVEFYVESASRFGALQLEITHLGNSGSFLVRGDRADCMALVDAIVASNYLGDRVAKVGLISLQGIVTPGAIVRCGFRTREDLDPGDFLVEVVDASDIDSRPLDPAPSVVVSSVVER